MSPAAPIGGGRVTAAGPFPADPRARWAELTPAEREDAYDNRKAVPVSAALLAELTAASARVRAERPGALDLAYGRAEREKVDLFPAASPSAPCLVFLHGGYWQRNARDSFTTVIEGVAAHGWSAALPGYTLAPEASLTTIAEQVRRVLDWLAAEGPAHGVAGPIILSGWSAGAQLTAMALDHPAVAAGLAVSGVFELGFLRDTTLNDALRLTDREVETLSPLRLSVVRKPMTVAYGTAELPALVEDSRQLHALRTAAGAPGALLPIEGANHFTIMDAFRRADGVLTRAALNLLMTA